MAQFEVPLPNINSKLRSLVWESFCLRNIAFYKFKNVFQRATFRIESRDRHARLNLFIYSIYIVGIINALFI